ncbi:AraC family transcriptional regulator [Prosthecomicrobium sp. N25]|uniref:AraC family transcriptional regulator n=1 Tax=Prosthecomicrobium sp. N25 TaxID=3129254 RepID=UPI0030785C71
MRRDATRKSYVERIERVVARVAAHVDGRRDGDLTLDELAGIACLSRWHFHRIYRAMMQETVAGTVSRLRLARAAADLRESALPVPVVARRAGFGSAAAFTRAFRARFGVTPAAYRRAGSVAEPPRALVPNASEDLDMLDVTVARYQPLRCAAVRHRGPYGEIGRAFDRLLAWAGARGLIGPATRCLAIGYDDPGSVPPEDLRSAACLVVGPGVAPEGEVEILTVAGGLHAVHVHHGPYEDLGTAYRRLYGEWLPSSGHQAADEPPFEEYLNDPRRTAPQDLLTAIHIPLA